MPCEDPYPERVPWLEAAVFVAAVLFVKRKYGGMRRPTEVVVGS